jgi:exodeoxyribonuclease VII large subunit
MSPVAVLARGYAIATRDDGRALRRAAEVATGEAIGVRLHQGSLRARVERVDPGTDEGDE